MKSGGVNWWGYAAGDRWLLIAIVACISVAALWYLIQRHLNKGSQG